MKHTASFVSQPDCGFPPRPSRYIVIIIDCLSPHKHGCQTSLTSPGAPQCDDRHQDFFFLFFFYSTHRRTDQSKKQKNFFFFFYDSCHLSTSSRFPRSRCAYPFPFFICFLKTRRQKEDTRSTGCRKLVIRVDAPLTHSASPERGAHRALTRRPDPASEPIIRPLRASR